MLGAMQRLNDCGGIDLAHRRQKFGRPHLVEHNEQFARALNNYHVRAMVKPGISGLAQISGYRGETRTDEDIIKRVSADIDYLENWSLSLDFKIILKTFRQVFFPPMNAC